MDLGFVLCVLFVLVVFGAAIAFRDRLEPAEPPEPAECEPVQALSAWNRLRLEAMHRLTGRAVALTTEGRIVFWPSGEPVTPDAVTATPAEQFSGGVAYHGVFALRNDQPAFMRVSVEIHSALVERLESERPTFAGGAGGTIGQLLGVPVHIDSTLEPLTWIEVDPSGTHWVHDLARDLVGLDLGHPIHLDRSTVHGDRQWKMLDVLHAWENRRLSADDVRRMQGLYGYPTTWPPKLWPPPSS